MKLENSLQRPSREAFTLLEILVALSITGMVILAVVVAFSSWVRTQERAGWIIDELRNQEYALTRLRLIISESYVPFMESRKELSAFKGMELERPNEPFDALTFASLGHRTNRIDARESELMEMTVFTVPDEELEDGDRCRILRLREGGQINDDFEVEGGMVYDLIRNVSRFQLFYLSPEGDMRQEWLIEEQNYQLPCAVIIWFGIGCGDEERDYCMFIPLYLTNASGCEFEEEVLNPVCEIKKW